MQYVIYLISENIQVEEIGWVGIQFSMRKYTCKTFHHVKDQNLGKTYDYSCHAQDKRQSSVITYSVLSVTILARQINHFMKLAFDNVPSIPKLKQTLYFSCGYYEDLSNHLPAFAISVDPIRVI